MLKRLQNGVNHSKQAATDEPADDLRELVELDDLGRAYDLLRHCGTVALRQTSGMTRSALGVASQTLADRE